MLEFTGGEVQMKQLKEELDLLVKKTGNAEKIIEKASGEKSVFPFSSIGKVMAYLLAAGVISYEEYLKLSMEYTERNKYLYLFDMAPRTFGETWGEKHILSLIPEFERATKKNLAHLYPDFDGEFDLWYEGIRIEVKACRANSTNTKGPLTSRAYLHDEARQNNFKYHYQQLKPSCCDVFIWIGVCRDEIVYWVLTSEELLKTGKLGSQHRNENTGIKGIEVFEGQVFMTEDELKPFLVEQDKIFDVVCRKGTKI